MMARFLGIDYGTVRVGVAVGDDATGLARPLATLDARLSLLDKLSALAHAEEARLVVVGRPMRSQGEPGTLDGAILHFAQALRQAGLAVEFWDEGGSSLRAAALHDMLDGRRGARGASRARRERADGRRDRTAAALLLQEWLDHHMEALGAAPDA
jgi:putative Holliday junction resolvase